MLRRRSAPRRRPEDRRRDEQKDRRRLRLLDWTIPPIPALRVALVFGNVALRWALNRGIKRRLARLDCGSMTVRCDFSSHCFDFKSFVPR